MAGPRSRMRVERALTIVIVVVQAACSHKPATQRATHFKNLRGDTFTTSENIRLAGRVDGYFGPESVKYDSAQDIYFVTNMMGAGSAKDNVAYIARINASDLKPIDVFIESGRNGVTLNAPKGTALQGDTLWVADIDVIRGFNRKSGAPTRKIDLAATAPQMLNDIDIAPDGTMYVTDTGIAMTDKGVLHPGGDKVIRIDRAGTISVVANATDLPWPNGVAWDDANKRWLVVSFDPFKSTVYALPAGGGSPTAVANGKGRYDGVEVLPDGSIIVSCWNDQSIRIVGADGKERGLIGNMFTPADIGFDTRRSRIAIPLASRGRVEFWDYKPLAQSVALR